MDILESVKAQLGEFETKRQALIEELRIEFAPILFPIFDKHKNVESINWNQYTPYFNDGEECEFSCNVRWLEATGDGELRPAENDFSEVLTTIPEDFYRDLFGDHVEITIQSNGTIIVDEYEHD